MRTLKTLYKIVLKEHLRQFKEIGNDPTFICCIIKELFYDRKINIKEFDLLSEDFKTRLKKRYPKVLLKHIRLKSNQHRTEYLEAVIKELSK